MKLFLDIGNSRIKWQLEAQPLQLCAWQDVQACLLQWQQQPVSQVYWVATVATERMQILLDYFQQQSIPQHRFTSLYAWQTLKPAYRDQKQLGDDRWAALIAARELYGNDCCVISAGTAITLDYIHNNQHYPGLILPGERLLRQALADNTQVAAKKTKWQFPPQSTNQCVQAGIDMAICGAIMQNIEYYQQHIQSRLHNIVLSGGSADYLQSLLNKKTEIVKNLIIKGLKIAYHQ